MQPLYFKNGLTIRELKELVKDLPEIGDDGEPLKVWVETGKNLSNVVTEVWPLDQRGDKQDIMFQTNAFND